jgi:hypothetical protein
MKTLRKERAKLRGTRAFLKKGTCSRTFFYILDREFGHPREEEEKATDPLAGGILQQGYQCGMLWGASMAVGAEAHRRYEDPYKATAVAILATQHIMQSFENRTSSIECEDITHTDFQNKKSFARYMLSGKFVSCFKLAGKWAPEALDAAEKGLAADQVDLPEKTMSCASEVIRLMGGSEEQIRMAAGLAGVLGLSGSGCGALAAAVWMNALIHNRQGREKSASFDPSTDSTLKVFYEETDYEISCENICGQRFNTLDEHTDFLKNGGCKKLMDVLAGTADENSEDA